MKRERWKLHAAQWRLASPTDTAGAASAAPAFWFVDRVSAEEKSAERAEFAELRTRIDRMERQLAELHAALVPNPLTDVPGPRADAAAARSD